MFKTLRLLFLLLLPIVGWGQTTTTFGTIKPAPSYYGSGTGLSSRYALYNGGYWYPLLTLQDTTSLLQTISNLYPRGDIRWRKTSDSTTLFNQFTSTSRTFNGNLNAKLFGATGAYTTYLTNGRLAIGSYFDLHADDNTGYRIRSLGTDGVNYGIQWNAAAGQHNWNFGKFPNFDWVKIDSTGVYSLGNKVLTTADTATYVKRTVGVIHLATITQLQAYAGVATTVILTDSLRGKAVNTFNYYPSITHYDNGIVFQATGKGSGAWVRAYQGSGWLYPEWWGAVPYDPVTNTGADSGPAINSAIDYSKNKNTAILITQKFRSTVPIQMGEGTYIKGTNASFPFQVLPTGDTVRYKIMSGIFFTSGTDGIVTTNDAVNYRNQWVRIENMGIYGTGKTNGKSGVLLRSNPNSTAARTVAGGPKITDSYIDGFTTIVNGNNEADGPWLERNHMSNGRVGYRGGDGESKLYYNITYLTDTAMVLKEYRGIITGSEIVNSNVGIYADVKVGGSYVTPNEMVISNNFFSQLGKGIVFNGGRANLITGNVFDALTDTSMVVSNSLYNIISNNLFTNQSYTSATNLPYLYLNAANQTTIMGNRFVNPSPTFVNKVGILANNSTGLYFGSQNNASTNITNGLITVTGTTSFATDIFQGNISVAGVATVASDVTAANYRFPTTSTGSVGSSTVQAANVWTQNSKSISGSAYSFGSAGTNSVNMLYNNTAAFTWTNTLAQPAVDNVMSAGGVANRYTRIYTAGTTSQLIDGTGGYISTVPVALGGTGSATQNFVDLTTAQPSIGGAKTFTAPLSNSQTVAATSTDGVVLTNPTAATSGVPVQNSPRLNWQHNVWNTTATAANNQGNWKAEVRGVSGTVPTSTWYLSSSLVTGTTPSFTDRLSVDNSGNLTTTGVSGATIMTNISGSGAAGRARSVVGVSGGGSFDQRAYGSGNGEVLGGYTMAGGAAILGFLNGTAPLLFDSYGSASPIVFATNDIPRLTIGGAGDVTAPGTITGSNTVGILATVTGVNAKTVAATVLYTVPAGKTAVIVGADVIPTAATAATNGGAADFYTATPQDILPTSTMTTLTTTGKVYTFTGGGMAVTVPASGTVKYNQSVGATGTTLTYQIILRGYLY